MDAQREQRELLRLGLIIMLRTTQPLDTQLQAEETSMTMFPILSPLSVQPISTLLRLMLEQKTLELPIPGPVFSWMT
jgi:hypothetical protein